MKMITAMVQPFMLNKVTTALEELDDFPGKTVTDVRDFGRRRQAMLEGHRIGSLRTSSNMSRRCGSRSSHAIRWQI
ncbi:hypothetical protein BH18ACI4_BH18ACI4_27390 [soil metagenome]